MQLTLETPTNLTNFNGWTLHLDQLLAAAVFTGARVSGLMVYCPFLGSDAIPRLSRRR